MSTFRGFIAVDIKTPQTLIDFENEIQKSGADVKLVEPKNIHITLKFLGDVAEDLIADIEQVMKDAVQQIKPFTITLEGTGVFPNQNYIKVVWIGINDVQIIERIARGIDDGLHSLGFKKEKRGFSAHITVGRVKTAKNKQQLLTILEKYKKTEFSVQEITSIKLKKSDLTTSGPIYTTIKKVVF